MDGDLITSPREAVVARVRDVAATIARDGQVMFERDDGAFAAFASLAARRFADTRKFREVEHQEILDFIREWEGRR